LCFGIKMGGEEGAKEGATAEEPKQIFEVLPSTEIAITQWSLWSGHTIPGKLYYLFWWLLGLALFGWFLANISNQYITSLNYPYTSDYFEDNAPLPLPQATICNWNQNGNFSVPDPTTPCPVCELTLVSCTVQSANGADCASKWTRIQYATPAGVFNCFQYNIDPNNIEYTNSTGYLGSINTLWKIQLTEETDPPENFNGLQVTLTPQADVTADTIFNEVQFAGVGVQAFYALQLQNFVRYDLKEDDPLFNTSYYIASNYFVNLATPSRIVSTNETYGYVGVSFGYQGLGKQTIAYLPPYSIDKFFGDFAGMIVLLTGLNLLKAASGAVLTVFSIIRGTFTPIVLHFIR